MYGGGAAVCGLTVRPRAGLFMSCDRRGAKSGLIRGNKADLSTRTLCRALLGVSLSPLLFTEAGCGVLSEDLVKPHNAAVSPLHDGRSASAHELTDTVHRHVCVHAEERPTRGTGLLSARKARKGAAHTGRRK